MSGWHTCNTTHCRAGWVVSLAGEEGAKLEQIMGTPLAAKMIYDKSSRIKVRFSDFFVSDEEAMASIEKAAKMETNKEINMKNQAVQSFKVNSPNIHFYNDQGMIIKTITLQKLLDLKTYQAVHDYIANLFDDPDIAEGVASQLFFKDDAELLQALNKIKNSIGGQG